MTLRLQKCYLAAGTFRHNLAEGGEREKNPSRVVFGDPVVLESICYRMIAK